jgi:hypothetical protein
MRNIKNYLNFKINESSKIENEKFINDVFLEFTDDEFELFESNDNDIKIIKREEEVSPLEKEFGVKLNTNRFLGDSEDFYDIYKSDEKVGYLVLSTDKYEDYDFEELLEGSVIYLNFIRLQESGILRSTIIELKKILEPEWDNLVLEVDGHDYNLFKDLKSKYESVGFIGIMPDNIGEFDLGLADEIDPYEEDVFMYLPLKK